MIGRVNRDSRGLGSGTAAGFPGREEKTPSLCTVSRERVGDGPDTETYSVEANSIRNFGIRIGSEDRGVSGSRGKRSAARGTGL